VPPVERRYFSVEGFYKSAFLKTQYGRELAAYNAAHGTACASWDAVHLDRRAPAGPGRTASERADWEAFVRTVLNPLWIRADAGVGPPYRRFLAAKYGRIDALNRAYGTAFASFDAVPDVDPAGASEAPLADWKSFLEGWVDPATGAPHAAPLDGLRVDGPDFAFQDFLRERYVDADRAGAALGVAAASWADFLPPQRDAHYLVFLGERGRLRAEFAVRNYLAVIDHMLVHGRAVLNTAVYCLLAVLAALIVNLLAAYALSRYRPRSAYKTLLFLMLTMAFPPMVTQIPAFLMLREMRLLNTFAALVLPGLANGYAIFLLKGFFDSLPRELYEVAELDGAGEFRIFWQITMSLSRPILAVVALNAFTLAYSNFMMALLICQDERMWTLMPWLYQLQQRSGPGVIFASLIVAALPTLIVFSFSQKVILRGIVVPAEK